MYFSLEKSVEPGEGNISSGPEKVPTAPAECNVLELVDNFGS